MKITKGSGNVYADIEVVDPTAMLAKAQLAQRIGGIIAARKLTQSEAAEIIGIAQPKLSNILRGQFRGTSETNLMDCLLRVGTNRADGVVGLNMVPSMPPSQQRRLLINSRTRSPARPPACPHRPPPGE